LHTMPQQVLIEAFTPPGNFLITTRDRPGIMYNFSH
jgi:hypothetical protein